MKELYSIVILAIILAGLSTYITLTAPKIKDNIESFSNKSLTECRGSNKFKIYGDRCDDVYATLFELVMNNYTIFQYEIEKIRKATKIDEDSRVLDAGSGAGYHIQILKKDLPGIDIEGVEISKSMLDRAKIRNPGVEFINTSLTEKNIYKDKSLTHILCLHDTLNHNTSMEISKILNNFRQWLSDDGYLVVHILDPNKLDPGPRTFSQYYKGKDDVRHALTYFEAFTHDGWWEKDPDRKFWYRYCEKYMFPKGSVKIKTTEYWIPPQTKMVEYITKHGFRVKKIMDLNDVEMPDFSLYVFQKE
jgi:SAM-dependent methyltransferase